MKATESQINELKEIVIDYLMGEFDKNREDAEDELEDIRNIPMAYTTNEPYYWQEDKYGEEVDVQGYVDIENFVIKRKVLDLIFEEKYDTFEAFRKKLIWADFGDYTGVDDNEWEQIFEHYPEDKPDWWDEYMERERK